ncbi:metallophosphoesterase family protein [Kiritimatiellota bacterium B12222]|nr:metallophosphoesterase family protein [Kiritimatiellota bacterium B12222]
MKHSLSLGPIETNSLLIFGGCYGNLEAVQALFAVAETYGIANEHIICTGDLVAYCADPLKTSELLRRKNIRIIQGNCEQALVKNADECGCGFAENSACETLSRYWFSYCKSQMNDELIQWFDRLPTHLYFEFGGRRFAVVHGSPNGVSEFIFASDPEQKLMELIQKSEVDCVISGHAGLPFTQVLGDLCWHNAGAIGLPANDGTPRVWYSLIRKKKDGIVFEHNALHYSPQATQEKMKLAKLPREYAQALATGLWPSIDILPEREKHQTGIALPERKIEWAFS